MKLTEQIINETSLTQSRNYSQSQANRSQRDVTCYSQVKREQVLEDKLAKRLAIDDQEEFTPISYQLMAKYIAYAKRCHFDGLDQEAEETIENFFLELLDKSNNNVSTAHLETLKKLTEAIAKLEMRESANKRDALDAIELVKFTMIDLFYDDVFDQLSSPSLNLPIGKNQGKKAKMKQLIQALSDACRQNKDKCFKLSEIKDLCKRKCIEEESGVLELVGCLNQSGILLLKGSDLYKFVN
jgi:DNA replicative helicase MCM subunit Mcm2 (Cdc46/Mcm family)